MDRDWRRGNRGNTGSRQEHPRALLAPIATGITLTFVLHRIGTREVQKAVLLLRLGAEKLCCFERSCPENVSPTSGGAFERTARVRVRAPGATRWAFGRLCTPGHTPARLLEFLPDPRSGGEDGPRSVEKAYMPAVR